MPTEQPKFELMPHNREAADHIISTFRQNTNSILYVSGVGTGKTYVALEVLQTLFQNLKTLYVVPKIAIESNVRHYKEFQRISECAHVDFCTYNAFTSLESGRTMLRPYSFVIIDEAHHIGSDIYGKVLRQLMAEDQGGNRYYLGLTATPIREKTPMIKTRINVGIYFQETIYGMSTITAIQQGLMQQIEYIECSPDKIDFLLKKEKYRNVIDFKNSKEFLQDIIRNNDKQSWLVFYGVVDKLEEHQEFVRELFPTHECIQVHSNLNNLEEAIDRLNRGDRVVVSCCDMFLEGIHLDHVEGILLFRSVHSQIVFQQIIGRVCKIGGSTIPLIVDCTDSERRLLAKLSRTSNMPGISFTRSPAGTRPINIVTLKNKKYIDISRYLEQEAKQERQRLIIYNDVPYKSWEDCCKSLRIPYRKILPVKNSLYLTWPEAIAYWLDQVVEYQGVSYNTWEKCCESLGLYYRSVVSIKTYKKISWPEALDIAIEQKKRNNIPDCSKVSYNGVQYASWAECCRDLGLPYQKVVEYKRDKTPGDWVSAIDHYVEVRARPKTICMYNGIVYSSWKELCRIKNLNYRAVSVYRCTKKITWPEAIDHYLQIGENGE